MPVPDAVSTSPVGSRRWSLGRFVGAGALLGLAIGFVWAWFDYGRLEPGFMYGHVLGMALLFGALGLAVAVGRNWLLRNPMA